MAYRRAWGDLIEEYKIIHEIYDSKTTGNILKLRDKIQLSLRGHNVYILEHKRLYNPRRVNYFSNRVVNNRNSLPNNDRNLKFSLFSLVIKNNLTFAKTSYFHFRKTAIVTYLFSLQ